MLTIRPSQRATKSSGMIRMKPASAMRSMSGLFQRVVEPGPEGGAERFCVELEDVDALGFGEIEAGRVGLVAGDQRDLVGAIVGAAA